MAKDKQYPVHRLALIFPEIDGRDYELLHASIAANGLRRPIVLFEGAILDGRGRLRACGELGIKPRFERLPAGVDAVEFIADENLNHRHLTMGQRALAGAEIVALRKKVNQHDVAVSAQAGTARMLAVSRRTLQRATDVCRNAVPEIRDMVQRGVLSIHAASTVSQLPVARQLRLVKEGRRAVVAFRSLHEPDGRSNNGGRHNSMRAILAKISAALNVSDLVAARAATRELDAVLRIALSDDRDRAAAA